MLNPPSKPVAGVVGVCVWLWVAACTRVEPDPVPQSQAEHPQTPNPAARKCVADGYELEAVLAADGLPIDHNCVDKTSGKRCEVWEYFRGECRLREFPQPSVPGPSTPN